MSWRERRRQENEAAREWHGGYRSYDLVKEFVIALGVVIGLTLVLTVLFSSPDDPSTTVKSWSRTDPVDFVTTAVSELDGSSVTATYGPPYNHNSDGQHIAFVYLAKWLGVSHPIDAAKDFVLIPLSSIPGQPALQSALAQYSSASAKQQAAWTTAYSNALAKAKETSGGAVSMPAGDYGPVATMMNALLVDAQTGGLDGQLLTTDHFYQTDYTKPLMFLADGGLLANRAQEQHLLGEQWGMMNETGSYPGQVWLWLYTFWYQIKPFSTSANADILVMAVMGVLSLAFILVPLIPGVSDLPRHVPIYKWIWRDHYRRLASE
jgi:hypothetical protein